MIHLIEFHAMGCQVSVQLEAGSMGGAILSQIPEQMAAIEARLTRFKPDSELMQLNACAGEWMQVSDVLYENISAAKHAALLTDGLYNPLILPALIASGYDRSFEQIETAGSVSPTPVSDWHGIDLRRDTHEVCIPEGSALDLGGIAKGWTAAHLADELAQHGACLVNIGGDIVGRGMPEDLPGWIIDIEDPITGEDFTSVYLRDSSIVTSGTDYRRWQDTNGLQHHHIIDPRTGQSAASDALAVTVMHPNATLAEAYAKAVLLRGADDGLRWLNQQWHAAGLVFRHDGSVLATSVFTR